MFEVLSLPLLIQTCAPDVAPRTMAAIVQVESASNPYAIGINGGARLLRQPRTRNEAISTARQLLAQGRNIDMGLGQINSGNMRWLSLSIEDAFDPCKNLAAASRVLTTNYRSVVRSSTSSQHALRTALSMYNTGDQTRGFRNGYVRRIEEAAGQTSPRLITVAEGRPVEPSIAGPASASTQAAVSARDGVAPTVAEGGAIVLQASVEAPAWDIFARGRESRTMVFGSTLAGAVQ